jgi:hypothetical protein
LFNAVTVHAALPPLQVVTELFWHSPAPAKHWGVQKPPEHTLPMGQSMSASQVHRPALQVSPLPHWLLAEHR